MKHLLAILICLLLASVFERQFLPTDAQGYISIESEDRRFRFEVDQLSNGRHRYNAKFYSRWRFLPPKRRSGILSESDYRLIVQLRRTGMTLTPREDRASGLDNPNYEWGTLERQGQKCNLRNAQWWQLLETEVGRSYWSITDK